MIAICTLTYSKVYLQVNLCQKHLFSHQITHNITKVCSSIYQFNTWKLQAQNMGRTCCAHKLFFVFVLTFRTIFAHNMFSPYSELVVFMYWTGKSMNNLLSYCGLVDPRISASDKDLPVHECFLVSFKKRLKASQNSKIYIVLYSNNWKFENHIFSISIHCTVPMVLTV